MGRDGPRGHWGLLPGRASRSPHTRHDTAPALPAARDRFLDASVNTARFMRAPFVALLGVGRCARWGKRGA